MQDLLIKITPTHFRLMKATSINYVLENDKCIVMLTWEIYVYMKFLLLATMVT